MSLFESEFLTTEVVLAVLCILANAFFVAAEFALVRVRSSRVQELAEAGNRPARLVAKMLEDVDGFLSTTQFGITICSLTLGWLGEPALARVLEKAILPLGFGSAVLAHSASVAISFALITFIQIVMGELVPRALAIRRAETYILKLAPALYLVRKIFKPLLWGLDRAARLVLSVIGVKSGTKIDDKYSEEEIRLVLMETLGRGAISDAKVDLIDNVFDFSRRTAKQSMISRDNIVFLDVDQPMEDNLAIAKKNNHTRYPLCEGSIDQITGLINLKDLMWLSETNREQIDLRQIRREVLFVPENKPLTKLLKDFQRNKIHMAIVIDEFGVTSGLVTLEDVLEELVGEIQDEYDQEVAQIQLMRDGSYLIDGATLIEEVEEKLSISISKGENTTIAGAVLSKIGRLPRVGDIADFEPYTFIVKSLKGRRINSLQVIKKARDRRRAVPPVTSG